MANNVVLNVYYDDAHHLALDLYPTRGAARGGVIVIHGGGWFQGDKQKEALWASNLAARGYFAIVPNYRLEAYPAPVEDMARLYGWLRKRELPFNFNHLAAVGASAGGNLAVEMAIQFGIPAVSLSGILAIDDWLDTHKQVVPHKSHADANADKASSTVNQSGQDDGFYKWFLQRYLPTPAQYADATPANHVTTNTGPMYLANSLDEFVPTCGVARLSAALGRAGIPHATRMLAGARHGEGYLSDVFASTTAFLDRSLNGGM